MLGTIFQTSRQKTNAVIAALLTVTFLVGGAVYNHVIANPCDKSIFSRDCQTYIQMNPDIDATAGWCEENSWSYACNKPRPSPSSEPRYRP